MKSVIQTVFQERREAWVQGREKDLRWFCVWCLFWSHGSLYSMLQRKKITSVQGKTAQYVPVCVRWSRRLKTLELGQICQMEHLSYLHVFLQHMHGSLPDSGNVPDQTKGKTEWLNKISLVSDRGVFCKKHTFHFVCLILKNMAFNLSDIIIIQTNRCYIRKERAVTTIFVRSWRGIDNYRNKRFYSWRKID